MFCFAFMNCWHLARLGLGVCVCESCVCKSILNPFWYLVSFSGGKSHIFRDFLQFFSLILASFSSDQFPLTIAPSCSMVLNFLSVLKYLEICHVSTRQWFSVMVKFDEKETLWVVVFLCWSLFLLGVAFHHSILEFYLMRRKIVCFG